MASAPANEAPMTWRALGPLAWFAIAAAAGAVGVAVSSGAPLAQALLGDDSVAVGQSSAEQEQRLEIYAGEMDQRLAQLQGRSMFYVPPPPEALAEEEPEEEPEPVETGPPPKPTRYAGPGVIAVVNGQVWFEGDRVVRVGEEDGGVRVVSAENAPWTIRVEWREVEFDVELFERTTEAFLEEPEQGDSES